jgi:hypothetical protein
VLHLAGYDHERDQGGMAAKESELQQSLGLPASLIERNRNPSRGGRRVASQRTPGKHSARSTRRA